MNAPRHTRPGFLEQLLRDERRRQFYSRALGWVMLGLLIAIGVLGVVGADRPVSAHPDCRAAQPAPPPILPMGLELAADPAAVRALLRGPEDIRFPAANPQADRMCTEDRIERHRALLVLDGSVFIPLYLMLGGAVLAWHLALALRARGADWARRGRLPASLLAALAACALALGLMAALDVAENQAAHAVLDRALGGLAPAELGTEPWRTAVSELHAASLRKWAAFAAWAATLALIAVLRGRSLAQPRGSARRRRWSARAAGLLGASALAAALLVAIGTVRAALGSTPAHTTDAQCWIGAGFAAMFVHALVLLVLHRLHLPRRWRPPALSAPPGGGRRAVVFTAGATPPRA